MGMPDEWLDLETDLHNAIMLTCERQGLDPNLARLIATDVLVECRGRMFERMRTAPRDPSKIPSSVRTILERGNVSDLEICKRQIEEAAAVETTDYRAEARVVAQRCWEALGKEDRARLRASLADELGREPRHVIAARLDEHSRRLAVLEAALEACPDGTERDPISET
jgi:hypothetical protein